MSAGVLPFSARDSLGGECIYPLKGGNFGFHKHVRRVGSARGASEEIEMQIEKDQIMAALPAKRCSTVPEVYSQVRNFIRGR